MMELRKITHTFQQKTKTRLTTEDERMQTRFVLQSHTSQLSTLLISPPTYCSLTYCPPTYCPLTYCPPTYFHHITISGIQDAQLLVFARSDNQRAIIIPRHRVDQIGEDRSTHHLVSSHGVPHNDDGIAAARHEDVGGRGVPGHVLNLCVLCWDRHGMQGREGKQND